jgi:hypothetical protein
MSLVQALPHRWVSPLEGNPAGVGEVADIGIGRHCGGLGLPSFTLKQRFARKRAQTSSGKLPLSLSLSICVSVLARGRSSRRNCRILAGVVWLGYD